MGFKFKKFFVFVFCLIIITSGFYLLKTQMRTRQLEQIIQRLTADSRVAQVLVTETSYDKKTDTTYTTIKFLEYDTELNPLEPKYFTFSGNLIQFQALVIRFDDFYIKKGHPLKGKSAYLFMKAFRLTDKGAEIFDITKINQVPSGYKAESVNNAFQEQLWREFWQYALNTEQAKKAGIKNAQIEAPGTKFVPGLVYTIRIEHSGGLRIDSEPIPEILK
jgi:hypothetical protein